MTGRGWAVTIGVIIAGVGGLIFAIWYTQQRAADGEVNALLDRAGVPRRPPSSNPNAVPVGVQQAMTELDRQYVLAATTVPVNPARVTEIIRMIQALKRRYPGVITQTRGLV